MARDASRGCLVQSGPVRGESYAAAVDAFLEEVRRVEELKRERDRVAREVERLKREVEILRLLIP